MVGGEARLISEGITIGALCAFTWVPWLFPPQGAIPSGLILPSIYLAFDSGVLFAIIAVGLRLGQQGRKLVSLIGLSIISLLIADSYFTYLESIPSGERWHLLEAPAYELHRALLALASYRSLSQGARQSEDVPSPMPWSEWAWWSVAVPVIGASSLILALSLYHVTLPLIIAYSVVGLLLFRAILARWNDRQAALVIDARQREATLAEQRLELLGAGILHDMAPSVTALLNEAHALEKIDPARAEIIRAQARHLRELLDQLRAYQESQNPQLTLVPLDVLPICAQAHHACCWERSRTATGAR